MSAAILSYARVVPELSLDRAFDYSIPPEWIGRLPLGAKVRVPFRSRTLTGFVIQLLERPEIEKVKPITEVLSEKPYLPPSLMKLAHWMTAYYCSPLGTVLQTLLPGAVRNAKAKFKERLWVAPIPGLSSEEVLKQIGKAKRQREAWESLLAGGGGWLSELTEQTGISSATWRSLADKGFATIQSETQDRDPQLLLDSLPNQALVLNEEQHLALQTILEESHNPQPKPILLHGVTGSGKTEVYLQAIHEILKQGKSAIVLVPEISLTPQTIDRFHSRFLGEKIRVAVLHSHLSDGERHDQWHQIRDGRAQIVIGARSAIFAPLPHLGMIVVDEEHEPSYKQEEAPHYQARDLAVLRGNLEKIPVILGSATPSLESYARAREEKYRILRLTRRATARSLPTMHVLDLRQEFRKTKKVGLLSERLIQAVQSRLDRHEQSLLFLNRRGYASSLQCPQCGDVQQCPHCSLPLTFHRGAGKLRCHLCNHSAPVPHSCPKCQFDQYRHTGMGTERIEETVQATFPKARIARIDSDTMSTKHTLHRTLRAVADREIDILIGTQMIAKGLHFPEVTCVGVINADQSLQLPDFRASERVFFTLMQVAGRAGRGDQPGEVFIQTRTPFHPAIQFARHHDYEGFADQELEFRKTLGYPPYRRTLLLEWSGVSEEKTAYLAEQYQKKIVEAGADLAEIGAAVPASISKAKGNYRFQVFIKTDRLLEFTKKLRPLLLSVRWPDGVRFRLDVDPVHLL